MKAAKVRDEIHVAEFAKRFREETKPLCPQCRPCDVEGLYPVRSYCVLSPSPGWLMIPSIAEYRTYCTGRGFAGCPWFRQTGEAAGSVEDESGPRPARSAASGRATEVGWTLEEEW